MSRSDLEAVHRTCDAPGIAFCSVTGMSTLDRAQVFPYGGNIVTNFNYVGSHFRLAFFQFGLAFLQCVLTAFPKIRGADRSIP